MRSKISSFESTPPCASTLKLQMGAVSQEVTVTDAPPPLQTEKTDVSTNIDQQKIDALPTLGHNTTYLYETVPGAVESIFQLDPGENPSGAIQIVVNGALFSNNEYLIDGITDLACCFSNQMVFNPNQEAVSEMKLSTNDPDPEFGNAAGLTAQFVTKSGTNQLHGSVFWANQNKYFFAADPFTQETPGTGPNGKGLGVAPYNWNQGGFSSEARSVRIRCSSSETINSYANSKEHRSSRPCPVPPCETETSAPWQRRIPYTIR